MARTLTKPRPAHGARLLAWRKATGLTQVELAEKIGIIQEIVSNYERDRLRMHAELVARFAKALDISADALLGLDDAPATSKTRKPTRRVLHLVQQLKDFPAHEQRALLKAIDTLIRGARATAPSRGA